MMEHVLEMRYPSSWWHDLWREGLVTGNGLIGANLYGGAKREILQLGHHAFWYQGLEEEVPDVQDAFIRLRKKMNEGNFREAGWEIVNALKEKGYASRLESHLPVANLIVEQSPIYGFCAFKRQLNMEEAVASQQWLDGDTMMYREVFVSRVKDMVVYRLRAEADRLPVELLEYKLELNAYSNEGEQPNDGIKAIWAAAETEIVCEDEHTGYLYFNSRRDKKTALYTDFGAVAKVFAINGRLERAGSRLAVKGADQILITIGLYVDEEKKQHGRNCTTEWRYRKIAMKSFSPKALHCIKPYITARNFGLCMTEKSKLE